jgi:flagellar secretion chaperone FliS
MHNQSEAVGSFSAVHQATTPMTRDASSEYLRNAVMTAPPEQLQMMLYDGAIRFGRQAREAMQAGDLETSCEKLIRCQQIVLELQNGLRPEVSPDLCAQMGNLYTFIHDRLVEANFARNVVKVDEALQVLEHLRETWQLLLEKLRAGSPSPVPAPAAQASREAPTLSLQA